MFEQILMKLKFRHIISTLILTIGISVFIANAENNSTVSSIVNESQIEVSMYPNPATSELNIDINNIQDSNFEVIIFSYLGNIVYKETIKNVDETTKLTIDIQNFRQGIYILQIKTKDSVSTHQFKKL